MRPKILLMTDKPDLQTGMGIVHRYIGQGLIKLGYSIVSIGWGIGSSLNYKIDWKVYTPDRTDYYGVKLFNEVVDIEMPDIVITIGDVWTVRHVATSSYRGLYQWIGYTAIDGNAYNGGVPSSWINILNDMDKIICYTEYGKTTISNSLPHLRDCIEVIPHGVDLSIYRTMTNEERNFHRGKLLLPQDLIIYLLVVRNQSRKNIPEIFKAWKEFTKDRNHERAILWPHMVFKDPMGWDIQELIDIIGIKETLMYLTEFANSGDVSQVIPNDQLNLLYNISDIIMLLSGEGFGLPLVEAMACSRPIIGLNHSACKELLEGRGELVDVGGYITGMHSTERPLPDKISLINKMDKLYYNDLLRNDYGKLGNQYVQNLSWENVMTLWDKSIMQIVNVCNSTCNLIKIS